MSKNFGQHYAITAGIDHAHGDWFVIIDCDLQDNPKEIINLYKKAVEGYDIVLAARKNRKDGFLKKFTSKLFYLLLSFLSGLKFNGEVGNFGIYNIFTSANNFVCSFTFAGRRYEFTSLSWFL